jgi:hypothetical protein
LIVAGDMHMTRIPFGANSIATDFVIISTAAFAAEYGPRPFTGLDARIDEKLTTDPFERMRYGRAA